MAHQRQALILAINPGSTSTKIGVFRDEQEVYSKTLRHEASDLAAFKRMTDQFEFRLSVIKEALNEAGIDIATLNAIVARGGLVKPIESGIYEVNQHLKDDLTTGVLGEHASNLGGLLADSLAKQIPGCRAFIADPVVVDELQPVARISGLPQLPRRSIFHALNQKAIARIYARERGVPYESLNLIVAHLGGGISVGAHEKGRVIDVNNALDGDGPFSPERAGSIPAGQLIDLCFEGKLDKGQIRKLITGQGGLVAHTGSNSALELEKRAAAGDKEATLLQDAMGYNIAKSIGAMATVLSGKVDAILITGGMAYNPDLTKYIESRVAFLAPVKVYPGEDELAALAMNGLMALRGELIPKSY